MPAMSLLAILIRSKPRPRTRIWAGGLGRAPRRMQCTRPSAARLSPLVGLRRLLAWLQCHCLSSPKTMSTGANELQVGDAGIVAEHAAYDLNLATYVLCKAFN